MASHRRTFAAAVATLAAAVSLYPVFMGSVWFWAGLGSVAVVAAAGTVTRLRRLPVTVGAAGGLVALLLYLNVAFAGARSLYHLLPTPGSMRFLWQLAGQGFTEAAKYAPPVPGLRGMVLLAAGGIGVAALLTDLIAVRLESAALAGLPLLLLFTEPFTLSVSRGPVGTSVAFVLGVAGYLALLSSEGRDRIREWEQTNPDPRAVPNTRALAAAGRRVGFASVVLALCLPLFIPGLHTTRLFGGGKPGIGGSGGGGVALGFPDPNAQLSGELHQGRSTPVLRYTTSASDPDYFQVYVLDKLTDSGWQLFAKPQSFTPASPLLPAAPGLAANGSWSTTVQTEVTLSRDLGQSPLNALPVPYPATVVGTHGAVRADRSTLMVVDSGVALSGLRYSVTSLTVAPPAQALEEAGQPPADIRDHYLMVPGSYDSLRTVATAVAAAAHAKTPLQDAVALQNWLSGGDFTYTLNAPAVTDANSLATFLEKTRRGYCQQFAFAMAVLARELGIPSRVAYGFTAGSKAAGGNWVVTTHDAHAWPELYFQGFGWLRFEPTPAGADGQGTATTPSYTYGLSTGSAGQPGQVAPAPAPTASGASGGTQGLNLGNKLRQALGGAFGSGGGAVPQPGGGRLSPWAVFGLVLAGLVLAVLAVPGCARLAVRRRRWRLARRGGGSGADNGADNGAGARRDAALAHAAWRELRDDLVDHGAGYLPSESPRAVAVRCGAVLRLPAPAAAALRRIALAEERARYAALPADGTGLAADSSVVRRAIGAATGRRARWRARLLPPSVTGPALAAVTQATDLFGWFNPGWLGRIRPRRRARGHHPDDGQENGTARAGAALVGSGQ